MAEPILVTGKRISDMELVTVVVGTEKIPTGQAGDLAITPNQIADHTIARGDLASHEDLSQVEVDLTTQIATLAGDLAAEEAARIAADNLKVDKEGSVSSVAGRVGDVVLGSSDVLVEGFGSQEDVNKYVPKPFLSGYTYGLGERVVLNDGEVVKSLVDGNLGDPNVAMTGWVSVVSDSLSDTIQTFNTTEASVDPVTGVADGAYFNVRSTEDDTMLVEYQNVGGVAMPSGKSYPSAVYVQNIAKHTALPFVDGKSYALYDRVQLASGDIVKSTVANNTVDPNVDMTGWVNYELDQKIRNGQIINLVSDFKAVGGTDCSAQIRAAILEALRTGKALYVPSTTAPYLYKKQTLTFKLGTDITDISANKCLYIFGDGDASEFKMMDGEVDVLYSTSFRFELATSMKAFYFKEFKVDNNARGSTPPANSTDREQSHTFSFVSIAGFNDTTLDSITYDNMYVHDPAADAFNNSYRGKGGTIRHINPRCTGRTRFRSDIQEAFGFKNIIISNPLVHSIEAEATIAPTNEFCFIQINGGTCEVLDLAGNSELDNLFVETNNVRVTGATNLGLIKKLTVNGGQLRINKDNARFPYLKDAVFNRVRVLHPYNDVTGAVTSLGYLRRPTCAGTIEWIEPEHVIDWEGEFPVAPTGELITNSGGTSIVSADVGLYNLIIRRAKFDPRIPKSIYAYRMGTVVLDNNQYGGTDCAIDWYATSGSATDLTVIGGDYAKVTGTALKIGGVSEGHKLKLTGDNWIGAKASSWKLLSGSLSTFAPAIYNYRKLTVDVLPTIALAKDVFQIGNIASVVGSVVEYQCTVSSLTAPTYVCSKQLGLYAAVTASLPVLTSSEKWARAHDTTTNSIKTWTGTAWI